MFNSSWPWERWADWPTPAGPSDPGKNYNASTLCHAFGAWQRQVAFFTARIVQLTGVDGVRLDGLGGQFEPCDNPSHHHTSPFENQGELPRYRCHLFCILLKMTAMPGLLGGWRAGTAANCQIARLTRQAMDDVGGEDAILSSEGYQDVFHPHTQMSLGEHCLFLWLIDQHNADLHAP